MLGRLRLGSHSLRGRRYPEPQHPYRNDFQRDRDRVVHSRAFRRLEGKTQVFAAGLCDHFRNRLTHTLEVAQVARTVASALGLNEDYTEVLALAHDLGHPPFGHSGERELDRQMSQFGERFEHNGHALRIVDLLEERYARFDGLNLTNEVREGIVKHSRELPPEAVSAAGEDLTDLLPGVCPPLEAQLIDAADEIAYNTADLDDSYAAGMLTDENIGAAVPLFRELAETVDTQFPGATPRVRFWEIQRELMNVLIGGLINGTVAAAERAGVTSAADVTLLPYRIGTMTAEAAEISAQIKTVLVTHVFEDAQLKAERSSAAGKVGELFRYLLAHPESISAGHRESLSHTPLHRVVCDFVAGMTDAYFHRTYKSLIG